MTKGGWVISTLPNNNSNNNRFGGGSQGAPGGFRPREKDDGIRANQQIRATWVRVIGKDGENLGLLETRKAVQMAQDLGLDLVEVAGKSDPPVAKIMDLGKYKYDLQKKAKAAKKNQVVVTVKEVQIRPRTDKHDIQHKAKSVLGFLEDGDKARVTVFYARSQMARLEDGWETLKNFLMELGDKAIIEAPPKFEGRRLSTVLAPLPPGKKMNPGHLLASFPNFTPPRSGFGSGGPGPGPA